MRELLRSNDMVLLSYVRALLDEAQIEHLFLDAHMSVIEGSLGVLPRRVLVSDEDFRQARRVLTEAGVAAELRDEH